MTEKDLLIQQQAQEIAGLKEELDELVKACYICTHCKHFREPCLPGVDYDGQLEPEVKQSCEPEWRGYHGKAV